MSDNNGGDTTARSRRGPRRRDLLLAGAFAAPALTVFPPSVSAAAPVPAFHPDNWNSVRGQFLLTRGHAHFSAFMLAAHPAPVRQAIAGYRDTLDSFPERYDMGVADIELSAGVRAAVARYVGAAAEEIALTDSATMGIGLVYRGLALPDGAEVVTTSHEFYSTYEALRTRAQTGAVTVREVTLYTDPAGATVDEIVGRLRARITDRTRVLALTWVHSSTGVKLPVRAIADMVASVNANRDEQDHVLLCLDGVHGFGIEDVDLPALGADLVMTSTHKWLFGPRGTGFVWGTPAAWRRMRPTIPSFSLPAFIGWLSGRPPEGPPGDLNSPGGYHSFEHRWALRAAIEFNEAIGRARIADRTRAQVNQLTRGLAELKHIRMVTPREPELSAGIVCCDVTGIPADDVVGRLFDDYRIAAGTTPYRTSYVRFGPSIVTGPDEVDRLVAAMAAIR